MGNVNFIYDELNSFGCLDAAGNFPDVINMGGASAGRLTVDLKLPDGPLAGAGPLTLSVQGADTEGGAYTDIVTGGQVSIADLNGEGYGLPLPKTGFRYLRAVIAGTFTGTVQAVINSYTGK